MRKTSEAPTCRLNVLVLVVVLMPFISVPVMGAEKVGSIFTMQLLNGRGWLKLPDDASRDIYLLGVINGLRWAWLEQGEVNSKLMEGIYIPTLSIGETRKGLNRFYDDPANANVIVIFALEILKMRVDGKPQADIDKQTAEARAFARDAIEGKPK